MDVLYLTAFAALALFARQDLRPRERRLPSVYFRALNGFLFWPAEDPDGGPQGDDLPVRRVFEVRSPAGAAARCTVEVAPAAHAAVCEAAGRDCAPEEAVWNTLCRSAVSQHVGERGALPPARLLLADLTCEQLRVIHALVGPEWGPAWAPRRRAPARARGREAGPARSAVARPWTSPRTAEGPGGGGR